MKHNYQEMRAEIDDVLKRYFEADMSIIDIRAALYAATLSAENLNAAIIFENMKHYTEEKHNGK